MKNLDDFINHMFPPVEDKPGYVWINKRNHEIVKRDLVKEHIERVYEQYRILQDYILAKRSGIPVKKPESNNTHIPLCKGLQADMVIIDEFLTEEETDGN